MQESQQVQHELENVKAAVAAEVQVVQEQVAAEKDSIAQRQQAIEVDRQRTLEIQTAVERRVDIKQQELTDREGKINQEVRALAKDASMLEQRFQQIRHDEETAQAQMEAERKLYQSGDLKMQKQLADLRRQLQQPKSKLEFSALTSRMLLRIAGVSRLRTTSYWH